VRRAVVIAIGLVLAAAAAQAKDYQSSFGFTFSAPDTWLIMTKSELASNPVFANADGGIKAKVQNGSVEIYYDRATSDKTFTDYVDVKIGPKSVVPSIPAAVDAACTAYTQALAKAAGRALAVTTCEPRQVGALKTFYIVHEGSVDGTVTMQYQVPRPDGRLVYFTATCKTSSLDKFGPDFDAIVKSVRFGGGAPSAAPTPAPRAAPATVPTTPSGGR
jgi:hypothetical protein